MLQLLSQLPRCVTSVVNLLVASGVCLLIAAAIGGIRRRTGLMQAELQRQSTAIAGIEASMAANNRGIKELSLSHSQLNERVEKDSAAQELLKRLAGVITELRAQLKVSAEGLELMRRQSGSIEQLRSQVQLNIRGQKELERQAYIIAELKSQVRSCESSWRSEISHQAGLLVDLRGHMGSSMRLLQQLQAQATKLDQAQGAIAQELRAQRREGGETSRRATLELALAELTHGRVDHVGQSEARGLTRTLIDKTFRRERRQSAAPSSNRFLSELLETNAASENRPQTPDNSMHSSSPVPPNAPLTVGNQTQESATSRGAGSEAGGVWGLGGCQLPKACSARGDLFNNLQSSTRLGVLSPFALHQTSPQPSPDASASAKSGTGLTGAKSGNDLTSLSCEPLRAWASQPCVSLKARSHGLDPGSSGQDQPARVCQKSEGKKPFLSPPGPAHPHRAMLAPADFINNMKAPGVSSRAHSTRALSTRVGSLGSARKKSYKAGGRQAFRPFVYESIMEAVRLSNREQRAQRRGSTGMPSTTPSMTSVVVSCLRESDATDKSRRVWENRGCVEKRALLAGSATVPTTC
ncbi:hypothetical protein WJX77_000036 [Trebouxia sp. C0004]